VFIARAKCGLTYVTIIALCSGWILLCISNSDWATENEAGQSVSVNGNEEPRCRDLSPIEFSCNCNYSLITHNKTPVHSTWGLLVVCAACPSPRLNLSSELRPSGNNIQDTFHTGSTQDRTLMARPTDLFAVFFAKFCTDVSKITIRRPEDMILWCFCHLSVSVETVLLGVQDPVVSWSSALSYLTHCVSQLFLHDSNLRGKPIL